MTRFGGQLRRIWWRAGVSCGLILALAVVLPRVQRALDPGSERRAIAQAVEREQREKAPVYVMPNGERRRAIAVTRADPAPIHDRRSNRPLLWWCAILAAVTLAGAVTRTVRLYLTRDEEYES